MSERVRESESERERKGLLSCTLTMAEKATVQAFSMSCTSSCVQLLIRLHTKHNDNSTNDTTNKVYIYSTCVYLWKFSAPAKSRPSQQENDQSSPSTLIPTTGTQNEGKYSL